MLNVAGRAKKGKNRYISGFRARSERRDRRFKSCYPDQQNLSNQVVSEVFVLLQILQKYYFDHIFLASTGTKSFSLFKAYQNLIHQKSYGTEQPSPLRGRWQTKGLTDEVLDVRVIYVIMDF